MKEYKPLSVQCFVKREVRHLFDGENSPRLLYVSEIKPDTSAHPRVMHAHSDFAEVILICSGSSEYLIGDKKRAVKAGDLLIYNAGVVHDEVTSADNEVGSYCVAVGGLHMPGLGPDMLIPENAGYVFPTGDQFETMRSMMSMMFDSLSKEEDGAEDFCSSLMHALLIKTLSIVALNHGEIKEPVEEPSVLGRRIREYIDAHYSDPITLQSVGDALHVSPYYMAHVFKEMSGYSPMQYLLKRRIGEAQTLLITTDHSITEIAGMVGYETQSYFNLQFTKHVGMPPKKYRDNYIVGEKKKKARRGHAGRNK